MTQDILEHLLQLFEQVRLDPDTSPPVLLDDWQEGSVEWRLLESFRSIVGQMQERIHQLKQAEEQLREQEELYHSAFDATNDGLFIGDLDGTIVEANPATCEMYGYTHEEMIGLTGIHLNHPDSHAQIEELNATFPPPENRLRLVALRKDGTTFYTEGQVAIFTYKGKPHRVAAVRDITEQVQAEQQLREKEEQYRSIFEAVTDSLSIARLVDGQIVEVNPAQCKMFGYTYEEMIGLTPVDLVHPDSLPLVAEGLQQFRTEGRSDLKLLRKDGTSFLNESHSTRLGPLQAGGGDAGAARTGRCNGAMRRA